MRMKNLNINESFTIKSSMSRNHTPAKKIVFLDKVSNSSEPKKDSHDVNEPFII
jgi:hypothetical protein